MPKDNKSRFKKPPIEEKIVEQKTKTIPPSLNNEPVATPHKESLITKIAQNPSYIIITALGTLLGALGGVPGFFQLFSYFTDKPSFKYHPRGLYINGYDYVVGKKEKGKLIIISGILENNGEKPLFINGAYELTVETPKYGKITGRGQMLPSNMDTTAGNVRVSFSNLRDLQTIFQLKPSDPIACSASFTFKDGQNDLFTKETLFTLHVLDLNLKRYEDTFHYDMKVALSGQELPDIGIKLLPITGRDTFKK